MKLEGKLYFWIKNKRVYLKSPTEGVLSSGLPVKFERGKWIYELKGGEENEHKSI